MDAKAGSTRWSRRTVRRPGSEVLMRRQRRAGEQLGKRDRKPAIGTVIDPVVRRHRRKTKAANDLR